MERDSYSDEQILDILSLKKIAVIGMSKHSSKAAHYVPKYLIDNGVAKERLQYKSFGNTQPIHKIPEKNDTERDENRRVEILILEN